MIELIGTALHQWDAGRQLQVADVDRVDLANEGDSIAPSIVPENGVVQIPDYLLTTGKTIFAYIVVNNITVQKISLPVKRRARPENYIYEDDRRNYVYRLIEDAETAIENANAAATAADEAAAAANKTAEELRAAKAQGEFNGPPASALIVTVADGVPNKTTAEIVEHIKNGGAAYLDIGGSRLHIYVVGGEAVMASFLDETKTFWFYEIFDDEVVEKEIRIVEQEQIGDIENALNELHAYAQALIGGGEE